MEAWRLSPNMYYSHPAQNSHLAALLPNSMFHEYQLQKGVDLPVPRRQWSPKAAVHRISFCLGISPRRPTRADSLPALFSVGCSSGQFPPNARPAAHPPTGFMIAMQDSKLLLPALYPLTRRRFLRGGSTSDWPMSETTTNDVIGPIRHTPQPPPVTVRAHQPVCTAALGGPERAHSSGQSSLRPSCAPHGVRDMGRSSSSLCRQNCRTRGCENLVWLMSSTCARRLSRRPGVSDVTALC